MIQSITLDGNKIHVRLLDNVHDYFDATYIYFVYSCNNNLMKITRNNGLREVTRFDK